MRLKLIGLVYLPYEPEKQHDGKHHAHHHNLLLLRAIFSIPDRADTLKFLSTTSLEAGAVAGRAVPGI
jgi:hypothetical protein